MSNGQIGFDLDSTLAVYDHWRGSTHIGEPIKPMVDLAKRYIAKGYEVVIFTARVAPEDGVDTQSQRKAIKAWCKEHLGVSNISVTCIKARSIIHYFDDRATGVELNTGRLLSSPNIQAHPFPNGIPK